MKSDSSGRAFQEIDVIMDGIPGECNLIELLKGSAEYCNVKISWFRYSFFKPRIGKNL